MGTHPEQARYDHITEFYLGVVGTDATDPSAATLLALLGEVHGLRALDVACGHGRITRELARRGGRATGADISRSMLAIARDAEAAEPLGVSYLETDITSGDALRGETFDVVSCNQGLADIDDLDGALRTVSAVLRPGGRFVFSLLHPCFPGWDADAPSSWPHQGGYHAEGWWLAQNPGIRGKVGANHRTLATYLNSLVRHHLVVERAAEPEPGPRLLARQSAAQPGAGPVPMLLVMACRKT
jgi:2-polyprenyl-3-methyl-5-hydroxy-6-metoxy-1,4-benzoquinol methylase